MRAAHSCQSDRWARHRASTDYLGVYNTTRALTGVLTDATHASVTAAVGNPCNALTLPSASRSV